MCRAVPEDDKVEVGLQVGLGQYAEEGAIFTWMIITKRVRSGTMKLT